MKKLIIGLAILVSVTGYGQTKKETVPKKDSVKYVVLSLDSTQTILAYEALNEEAWADRQDISAKEAANRKKFVKLAKEVLYKQFYINWPLPVAAPPKVDTTGKKP